MKKKVIGPIICLVLIVGVVFGTLYVIDHKRMDSNEPVLFSTWGYDYAPPEEMKNAENNDECITSISSVMCTAQKFYNSEDGSYLEIVIDDEKHTMKKLAVNDETLIKKISETDQKAIIGVQVKANVPVRAIEEKRFESVLELLTDYDDYDEYFEIVDVSISNEHSFVGTVLEETTTYMIVEPSEDEAERDIADKIKIDFGTDHKDYLYGIGRKVVIYYKGGIDTTEQPVIKSDDISVEGFREWELTVEPSNTTTKKLVIKKQEPHDSDLGWYKQYNLYYYGLADAFITVDGQKLPLQDAIKQGKISMLAILARANRDVSDGLITDMRYKDGGSVLFKYPDYTIIKYNTLDGNNDLYIGTPDMDIDAANK